MIEIFYNLMNKINHIKLTIFMNIIKFQIINKNEIKNDKYLIIKIFKTHV